MVTPTNADSAPDQVARLLALVPYLHQRREVRLEHAAAHFDVTPDQLVADLRVLFLTGLPGGLPDDLIDVDIEALEGEGVIRVANADYLARPVRFAPAEATALVVALRTLLETAAGDTREVVARTLAKLEAATAQETGPLRVHAEADAIRGAHLVPTLEEAISTGTQVEIGYHVASRDEQTSRVVDPRGLSSVEGVIYLDAWCHSAGAERVFRLDRMTSATRLETPVADRTARPRDLTASWFTGDEAVTVTLRLAPAAAWVPEYYRVLDTRPGPDGTLDVDLVVGSQAWLRQLLFRLAPHATVVAPARFAEGFRAAVGDALTLYPGQA